MLRRSPSVRRIARPSACSLAAVCRSPWAWATVPSVSSELAYEKRFGAKTQLELAFPANFAKRDSNDWIGGIGDFVIGLKRVLAFGRNSILSVQGEVAVPTGNRQQVLRGN